MKTDAYVCFLIHTEKVPDMYYFTTLIMPHFLNLALTAPYLCVIETLLKFSGADFNIGRLSIGKITGKSRVCFVFVDLGSSKDSCAITE